MSEEKKPLYLIWIDLETTGLDAGSDSTLAIGCRVTTPDLRVLGEQEHYIGISEEFLAEIKLCCDPVAVEMHTKSGLFDKCRASSTSTDEADKLIAAMIRELAPEGERILAGNSVHFDRGFLVYEFYSVDKLLHYRHFDVSVFKTLAKLWGVKLPYLDKKDAKHTPLADLDNSFREFALAKQFLLKEISPCIVCGAPCAPPHLAFCFEHCRDFMSSAEGEQYQGVTDRPEIGQQLVAAYVARVKAQVLP